MPQNTLHLTAAGLFLPSSSASGGGRSKTGLTCLTLALVLLGILATTARAADAPAVRFLRTQTVGDVTYFHVGLAVPGDARAPTLVRPAAWSAGDLIKLACLPRLVPRPNACREVILRMEVPEIGQEVRFVTGGRWEFVGQVRRRGPVTFRLIYPSRGEPPLPLDPADADLSPLLPRMAFAEVPLVLDFSRAESQPTGRDDLRKLWAAARAAEFAVLEAQAPSISFYGLARELTARKYGVKAPALTPPGPAELTPFFARLYESAADATILAAAAQARRLQNGDNTKPEPRTIDVAKVARIDLPDRDWEKLLGDKKPEPEPLAKLAPRDNLYAHFRSVIPIVDVIDLFSQINDTGFQEVEGNSRDYQLQARYERQFALPVISLSRTFGPAVVRTAALTASDPYLREGNDMTALFQVVNRTFFYLAHDQFLVALRREFGPALKQDKQDYLGVIIESFVTPRREVSSYRAGFDEYVVISNSLEGMKRVIDTYKGKIPSMATAPDFRYYRSVYMPKDPAEDGFIFLSTSFLRRLLGPEMFVKRRRRLEAFTSLYLTTNAALFAAWETGM